MLAAAYSTTRSTVDEALESLAPVLVDREQALGRLCALVCRAAAVGTTGRDGRRGPCRFSNRRRAAGASFTSPCLESFAYGNTCDHQAGDRVRPRPTQSGVQEETSEEHCRQIGAQQGLGGVRHHGIRSETPSRAALRPRQERHDHQGRSGQGDSDRGGIWLVPAEQGTGGFGAHVGRQREEGERHQAQSLAFTGLRHLVPKLPQDDQATTDLDDRVQAEADQRDRPGDYAGGDCDERLEQVVADRGCGQ